LNSSLDLVRFQAEPFKPASGPGGDLFETLARGSARPLDQDEIFPLDHHQGILSLRREMPGDLGSEIPNLFWRYIP
jgi:hypothetical protein